MRVGRTLFAQVMEYVPWKTFERIIQRHRGDIGVKKLGCADLFRIMAFSQLTYRESLRDIEICLSANQEKLFHMGLKHVPAKSTLSDALNSKDWRIYHELALRLTDRARRLYVNDPNGLEMDATVYALDSTTIDLCLSLFDWAPFRTTKAGIKLHTLLDLRGAIPAFIHISDAKMSDVKILDTLLIEAGAFYIMDRGYVDFKRLYKIHQTGAFFVTRAKSNMNARRLYSKKVDKTNGIICDQTIALNGVISSKDYPEYLRRVRFKDPITKKTLIFLTNNTSLPSETIVLLYKHRWQVELFFKWIKQHLRIKRFMATTETAVKTQIWCAISTYLLIAIIKKELNLKYEPHTLLQILSVSIFEKTQISRALQPIVNRNVVTHVDNQLNLFNF
jgi:Transposase DDE domain/Domain of unknown function (DUF4372)